MKIQDAIQTLGIPTIRIRRDLHVEHFCEMGWQQLPFEIERYCLRRLYEKKHGYLKSGWRQQLLSAVQLDFQCERLKCRKPIPRSRAINGLSKDQVAKYCSFRCERTSAQLRYKIKKRSTCA